MDISQLLIQIGTGQLNYMHMVCGLAYFALGYVAYSVGVEDSRNQHWRWIALFALTQFISAWIGVLQHSVLPGIPGMTQMVIEWIGWAALAQFGLRWKLMQESALKGYWIYGVMLLALAAGVVTGQNEMAKSAAGAVVAVTVAAAVRQSGESWPATLKGMTSGFVILVSVSMALKVLLPLFLTYWGDTVMLAPGASLASEIAVLLEIVFAAALAACGAILYKEIRTARMGERVVYYRYEWWIAAVLPLMLIFGFFATGVVGAMEANSIKHAVIREASIAAIANDLDSLKKMTGTDPDLETAEYGRIYGQQVQISKANPLYRWTYLLQEKDGKIIILTDSDPEDSPEHTPVTMYDDAPAEAYQVFASGRSQVIGPYHDQWGTWITPLVPVVDPSSRKIIAVQGIDIAADKFNEQVNRAQFQVIVIAWLFAIMLLVAYYFDRRLRESLKIVKQSEVRYSAIVNNSMDAVVLISDGVISLANDAALRLFGRSREETLGHSYLTFVHPDDREMINQRYRDRMAGRTLSGIFEFRILKPDGEIRYVETSGVKIDDLGKDADLVQMHDVTRRKNAEAELQEASRSVEDIIDSLPDSTFVVDSEGRVIAWNRAMEKMTGISKQQIIGRGDYQYAEAFYGERRPMVINMVLDKDLIPRSSPLQIYEEAGTVFAENYTPYVYGGKGAYLWATASVLYDSYGRVKGAIETIRDITERKQMEEEINASNERLKEWLDESETTKYELMLTGEMIRKIDSSEDITEAVKNACYYINKLFRGERGFIAIFNEDSGRLEVHGSFNHPWGDVEFRLSDCWATKLNRPYFYSISEGSQPCNHMRGSSVPAYVEVPLAAQNKLIGMLCIQCMLEDSEDKRVSQWLEYRKYLLNRIAAQLSLALANTQLRVTLRRQAIIDPLTGLYNRRYMHEALEKELRRSHRSGKSIGFIMGDIDYFKRFNDCYGHDVGDHLLKSVAGAVRGIVRSEDIVCRYGGEEFLIILPSANLEDTCQRAMQVNAVVKNIVLNSGGQKISGITISLGVSAYPDDGMSGDELINAADAAMYRAKREGRDRVCLSSSKTAQPVI